MSTFIHVCQSIPLNSVQWLSPPDDGSNQCGYGHAVFIISDGMSIEGC